MFYAELASIPFWLTIIKDPNVKMRGSEVNKNVKKSRLRSWPEFRFSVIGNLLASPPNSGDLKFELEKIACRNWTHPTNGEMR
jgi:hypothetical protein